MRQRRVPNQQCPRDSEHILREIRMDPGFLGAEGHKWQFPWIFLERQHSSRSWASGQVKKDGETGRCGLDTLPHHLLQKTVTDSSLVSTILPLKVMVRRAGRAGNMSGHHSFYPWPGRNRKHYLTWTKAIAPLRLTSPLALCASRTKVSLLGRTHRECSRTSRQAGPLATCRS